MVKKAAKKTTKVPTKPKTVKATSAKRLPVGKVKNIWNKHWQLILVGGIVIGILGFIGINQLIIYNQKQQFKAAEESLDALYADIVSKVGQPTSYAKDKSCSYSSAKLSRGSRSCGIGYIAHYSIIDTPVVAKSFSELANSVVKNNKKTLVSKEYPGYETHVDEFDTTLSFKFLGNDLECSASYSLNKDTASKNQLVYTLDCYDFTRAEFYPVKD